MKFLLYFFTLISFASSAQTYVPDNNFEQALIDLGYDDILDDFVNTNNIQGITTLVVGSKNIADMTGIEDFIALQLLNCCCNNLTALNLTANTNLQSIDCSNNEISNLNISGIIGLTDLSCYLNELSIIDVSTNTSLENFFCSSNNLSNLDITTNLNLQDLDFWGNSITSLNTSTNTNLTHIRCDFNNLSSFDLTTNTSLNSLECNNNNLQHLELSSNPIYVLLCYDNPNLQSVDLRNGLNSNILLLEAFDNPLLTCLYVDNVVLENPESWFFDSNTHLVVTEAECDALRIETFSNAAVTLYPNPAQDYFSLSGKTPTREITLHDLNGRKIKSFDVAEKYDISDISNGLYIIKITSEAQSFIFRLLKS